MTNIEVRSNDQVKSYFSENKFIGEIERTSSGWRWKNSLADRIQNVYTMGVEKSEKTAMAKLGLKYAGTMPRITVGT
jgi:hypothetical protein